MASGGAVDLAGSFASIVSRVIELGEKSKI